MASLKEIKGRIGSVEGTLKITSAMKMVASAKLHKAQVAIEGMLPYDRQLHRIMTQMMSGGTKISSPLCISREHKKRVAVVCVASNSSLCGGYNSNVVRHTVAVLEQYKQQEVDCYVIGRKLDQSLGKLRGFNQIRDYVEKGDNPAFATAQSLATRLMNDYIAGRIDEVKLVYMHFKNTASQVPTVETFLPITPPQPSPTGAGEGKIPSAENASINNTPSHVGEGRGGVYIIEPTPEEVLNQLIPDALCMKIFTIMLDAQAAEHAARTVAMQTATDNANELLDELRIQYNKGRQAAITAELLDIVGGSMQ